MLIIRPMQPADLDDLMALAKAAGQGMTSLPEDPEALLARIQRSCDSFARQQRHHDDFFFLAMEDTEQQRVVGSAGVYAMTGARQAFYAYRLMTMTHFSHSLQKQVRSQMLHLTNDYTDCSEVGSLFLDPAYRGNGHWLARSRYLLMGLYPDRFAESVIAEMRGWTDAEGNSPFWDAIGRQFFEMEFDDADTLCGVGSNQFITELMPKYPIYTNLLPAAAQAVIGRPADAGRRAKELLEEEGFRFEKVVDIFDAGPLMRADLNDIASVRAIRQHHALAMNELLNDPTPAEQVIAANPDWANFRVICTQATEAMATNSRLAPASSEGLALSDEALTALQLHAGDPIAWIPHKLNSRPAHNLSNPLTNNSSNNRGRG
ncbi:arginine N-succinyltransferase [Oceanobacter mangrovi]|uniref:arginine N-succinyltransferase n=1 Tax=Oceanobacter mangrovi TaxID=2862510 RepID=UPI001C8D9EB2|nr:arginine N-succinyltransferase [Oceanobacter mangrovi]